MNRYQRIIKVSIIGIVANIILSFLKAVVGLITNSIAISLDAVNNMSDALSSIITIIGAKLSTKKPDKEHPYGHGRIEYFSATIISGIILAAGFSCLARSIEKIIEPAVVNYSFSSLLVIILAITTKLFLGNYFKKSGKKLNSNSLYASGVDAIGDSLISLSTLIAALLYLTVKINVEGYVGILISLMILKSGYEIFKSSINDMIGIRADENLTKNLKKEINSFDEVLGVHDLFVHNYGPNNIITTVHIDVIETMNAKQIHKLTREITMKIYEKFGIIITIGIYATTNKKSILNIKNYVVELIKNYKNIIEIHGFFVDEEEKSISFDIIFDFAEENANEIIKELEKNIKKKYPKYETTIIIDTDVSD